MNSIERISLDRTFKHPLVVIREHLIRYILAIQSVLNKDVLDIACGTGYGMYLMSFWAKSITGYDYDKLTIKMAKRDYQMKCPAYFKVLDLEKVKEFKNPLTNKFDVITCFETLEHLNNPIEVIETIKKHLKKKAVVYFSTPNKKNLIDKSKFHKMVFNWETWEALMKDQFPKADCKIWGQDQYGFTDNKNKPYIVTRIRT